jgi:triphosphoribosyl-dephospho-CoA synthetase
MATAAAFDFVCEELERATSLNTLEARGTVRLALKAAGIDAKSASAEQLRVVVTKLLPAELQSRGCSDADRVCREIAERLVTRSFEQPGAADSPEAVFARLGGR